MAITVVGHQQFTYLKYLSRSVNSIGVFVPVYDTPRLLTGQVQPLTRTLYQEYGLDFQKYYLMFYVSKNMLDLTRDVAGDRIKFNGNTYQCVSETDWFPMDGWIAMLAIKID